MINSRTIVKRLVIAAGLALGVLAAAALGGAPAGADAPRPAPGRTTTPAPTATPGSPGIPSLCPQTGCMAPPISPVEAKAAGTYALVSFTTIEPAAVTVDYKPATPMGTSAAAGQSPAQGYATTHERRLTGLASNTTYDVTVTAQTQSGQKHTAKTSFTTAKKRVRITLESIDIKDDGDLIGDGEPLWFVTPGGDTFANRPYNADRLCYPKEGHGCKFGKFGEGRFTPRNEAGRALMITYAEELFDRFPTTVSLKASAAERDDIPGAKILECLTNPGCPVGDDTTLVEWRVPQGVEFAEERRTVAAVDGNTGFESVLTFHFELLHVHASETSPARNRPTNTWTVYP